MSLLSAVFENSKNQNTPKSKINWIPLIDLAQLDEIVALSNEKPVAIFKHSTRCSVSRFALKQFENEFNSEDKVLTYFLDLLAYRAISNEIAARFGVHHQSPQLLLIKDEKSVYNVSHSAIDAKELEEKIEE